MGFRLDRRYVLKFEGDLEGLEVKLKATPISVVLEAISPLPLAEACALLAQYIDEWNYEDEQGNPVPLEAQAIQDNIEEPVLNQIFKAWVRAAKGITAPLSMTSTDGEPSKQGTTTDLSTLSEIPMQPIESQQD